MAASRVLQRVFLGVGVCFCTFVLIASVSRSVNRNSLTATLKEVNSSNAQGSSDQNEAGSLVRIRDFMRSQVKDGVLKWKVEAKEARYFTKDGISQLTNPSVRIYRPDGSIVHLQSSAAKLVLNNGELVRAEFEGSLRLALSNQLALSAEQGIYRGKTNILHAFGNVLILGPSYRTKGAELEVDLTKKFLTVNHGVKSKYDLVSTKGGSTSKLNFQNLQKSIDRASDGS